MLIRPPPKPIEGPRSFRLRTLQANLISGAMTELLHQDGEFADAAADQSVTDDWIHRLCRWCPQCLRTEDEPYGRIGWEIRFADACTVCGNWLVDRCESCAEQVSWSRPSYFACRCGQPLCIGISSKAPTSLVSLCKALEYRALKIPCADLPIFNGLNLHQCLQVVRWLGCYGGRVPQRVRQKLFASDLLEVSWPITTLAAEVLFDWPRNFHKLLNDLKTEAGAFDGGSLSRSFRGFYRVMYTSFNGPEFRWLREAFENYVAEHWTGTMARRNRRIYEQAAERLEWIPDLFAARHIGISRLALHRLSQQGLVELHSYVTASGRRFSKVSKASIARLSNSNFGQALTLTDAAKVLGLKKSRLQSVLEYICPQAFKLQPTNVWMIPKTWLEQFLDRIQQLPVLDEDVATGNWVTLDWLFRYELPSNEAAGLLIKAIRDESVKAARTRYTTELIHVMVCRSSFHSLCNPTPSEDNGYISLMDAATLMRIKQEVVYSLVRSNLLVAEQRRIGRRTALWVTRDELTRFEATFIFGRDLAKSLATSSRSLMTKLNDLGVLPVAGPSIDSCRQLVFRRSDIAAFGVSF